MYDYALLEQRLSQLLNSLATVFSESERTEVKEFLDAGEYGLALETACAIITDEQKKVGFQVFEQVKELHDLMELDSDIVAKCLGGKGPRRE